MKKYIALAVAAVSLVSCDDFLDCKPLDFGDQTAYFTSPEDFALSCNQFYEYLPKNADLYGGIYNDDNKSDNQAAAGSQSLFYRGEKKTVNKDNSEWNFKKLRSINFFINTAEAAVASGHAQGAEDKLNHYIGEGYFFRAYDCFRLLRNFGDAPILTEMLPDDQTVLAEKSKRYPRNEVARFILSDLDKAIELLADAAPESGRVYKDAARALKARVALYEGTWEKYHAGTCFVPGNDKWVGKTTWPEFAWPLGSADAEVNFFLDEAMKAAKEVADARQLDNDYLSMFNNWETAFGNNDEVILARYYKPGALTHNCTAHLNTGGNCGVTRALVNSFVMASGLPIYADSDYLGDEESYYELQGRDGRLTASVRPCGRIIETKEVAPGKYENDTIYYYRPNILGAGQQKSTTGYDLRKWVTTNDAQQITQQGNTSAVPLFRAAECYLIYMEASYLRNGKIDDTADKYWRALRHRAGVDEDYNKTITATDLTKENDLAVWSKGQMVDATLYNIRRERRCEFIAEGMRLDDLKRWRALDMMVDYQVEGMNLWDKLHTLWGSSIKDNNAVSQSGVSKYIRPLQVSATSAAYNGYNFPKQHYLEPIPLEDFNLTGGFGKSTIYQNPGWPDKIDGTADYSYDCD